MSRRFILDTNAVSDLIYKRRGVYERAMAWHKLGSKLGTCPPVLGELFSGAMLSSSRDRNILELKAGLRGLKIWPFHTPEAVIFGNMHSTLKKIGRPMQVVDIQLAAVALALGNCTVVTSDSDLSAIPGLSVENWANA